MTTTNYYFNQSDKPFFIDNGSLPNERVYIDRIRPASGFLHEAILLKTVVAEKWRLLISSICECNDGYSPGVALIG